MSQTEIYEILKNKRLSGDERFFSQAQISKLILDGHVTGRCIGSAAPNSVHDDLKRLSSWHILDKYKIKGETCYRLKKKVLNE